MPENMAVRDATDDYLRGKETLTRNEQRRSLRAMRLAPARSWAFALTFLSSLVLAGALALACNDAKAPEPGPPDAGMASPSSLSSAAPPPTADPVMSAADAATVGSLAGDAGSGMSPEPKTFPPVTAQVKVTFGGKESNVTLTDLPHDGGSVTIPALVKKALPNQDPTKLKYDLVGSDGFHVGSRAACDHPLSGPEIANGKMDVASHNVTYDADSKLPGCYRVHAVVRIDVTK